jgi:hypothetical protein
LYIDFQYAPLGDVAAYLPTLTHKPVIVIAFMGNSITYRFSPQNSVQKSLDELAAVLQKENVFLSSVDSCYFRMVNKRLANKAPASSHLEIRIENNQLIADGHPVTMDSLIEQIGVATLHADPCRNLDAPGNPDFEVWVYDAETSTNLSIHSIAEPIVKVGVDPDKLLREYLPRR